MGSFKLQRILAQKLSNYCFAGKHILTISTYKFAVSLAYKYFTSLSNRERTHLCAPENCCSFDENSHFTSQNKGAAGLPLPQMVSLFVLLCNFGV